MQEISKDGLDDAGISGWSDVSEAARDERAANATRPAPPNSPEEAAGLTGRTDVAEAAATANAQAEEFNAGRRS